MPEETPNRYFILNKPYEMVSQFVSTENVRLLGSIDFDFPTGTHAIGRLDNLSEGLLILTTNKKVTGLLFHGEVPHKRTYLVQVSGHVSDEMIETLKNGVSIKIKNDEYWTTSPCEIEKIEKPDDCYKIVNQLHERNPFTWLKITLIEGKYHQIRKMVNRNRHHCKRLIRVSIAGIELQDLAPGAIRELDEITFFDLLGI
jgi:23S rRNA pseudouridine2457 synthase